MDQLLTVAEAASMLACSQAAVRKWLYQRRLPVSRWGASHGSAPETWRHSCEPVAVRSSPGRMYGARAERHARDRGTIGVTRNRYRG